MGISDDIKPKKVHRFVEHPVYRSKKADDKKTENKLDEKQKKLEKDLHTVADKSEEALDDFYNYKSSDRREDLEDKFFSGKYDLEKPLEIEHRPKKANKHRPIKRIVIFVVITILAVLIIYQNIDIIKSYFTNKSTESLENVNDNYYTGESSENSSLSSDASSDTDASASKDSVSQSTTAQQTPATIKILNGNGINGSAAEVKTILVNAGMNVDAVSNAKKFTYTQTYIYYKTGFETEANSVKTALSSRAVSIEQSDQIACDYDIVVVVGKK